MAASPIHHALFPTAIGIVGVAWSARGLTALALPERDEAATERRLRTKSGSAGSAEPPPAIAQAIALIQRYCAGARVDFSLVPLDLSAVDPERRRVYQAMRALRYGETTTYGALARQTGAPEADWEAAKNIGIAMGRNPLPIVVPCHRVVAADGLGGYSGATAGPVYGIKPWLLAHEGYRDGNVHGGRAAATV